MEGICDRPSIDDLDFYVNTILTSSHLEVAKDVKYPYIERISAFARHYRSIEPHIIEFSRIRPSGLICSYFFDYNSIFTPIERNTWNYMRCIGYVPLYPQYPVGRFIVDFANPYFKIGLELDGAAFHDKEKDARRDLEIKKLGWTIYRATGSESNIRRYKELSDLTSTEHLEEIDYNSNTLYQEMSNWFIKTAEGLIFSIRSKYFSPIQEFDNSEVVDCWTSEVLKSFVDQSLSAHISC